MTILHIGNTQIRPLDKWTVVLFTKRKPCLYVADAFECHQVPTTGNLGHPGVTGRDYRCGVIVKPARHRTLNDGLAEIVECFDLSAFGSDRRIQIAAQLASRYAAMRSCSAAKAAETSRVSFRESAKVVAGANARGSRLENA